MVGAAVGRRTYLRSPRSSLNFPTARRSRNARFALFARRRLLRSAVRFVFFVLALFVHWRARNDITPLQPAPEVDGLAAARAERGELRISRLAANRAGLFARRRRLLAHSGRQPLSTGKPSLASIAAASASGKPTTLL